MRYISTRGAGAVSGAEAIVRGLAPDGGLYVPEEFPRLSENTLRAWAELDYAELAAEVLYCYLPELGKEKLSAITASAASRFDAEEVTPLVKVDDDTYFLELWHGPTHAFKDVALTTLPHLLTASRDLVGVKEKILILVATSGDTGKAALEGFRDVDGTHVAVLYPSEGVSAMQKLQMTTQEGGNVSVWGIEGNFDDAQTAVKKIFVDGGARAELAEKGWRLSSANSINLGRLLPQIVYYFSAYFDLANAGEIKFGDAIDFCVPTGNFGDILAGYYAKRMGLPVKKLVCASNSNDVLTQFLSEGTYAADRPFYKTISPSMDILVSSNLERLLFEVTGRDAVRTAELMSKLSTERGYAIGADELAEIQSVFYGACASEDDTRDQIAEMFDGEDYIMDPHTAVASFCADSYVADTGDAAALVVLSTASPYKFVEDVLDAIEEDRGATVFESVDILEELTALEAPGTIRSLERENVRFRDVLRKEDIRAAVLHCVE